MSELTDFLMARGYLRIPLTGSGVGHFHTAGTLNECPVEVLVDTGAACTVVAAMAEALGLQSEWIDCAAGGLAGPIGLDFELNAPLRTQASAEMKVIAGVDAFDPHAAVIDYRTRSLFLLSIPGAPCATRHSMQAEAAIPT